MEAFVITVTLTSGGVTLRQARRKRYEACGRPVGGLWEDCGLLNVPKEKPKEGENQTDSGGKDLVSNPEERAGEPGGGVRKMRSEGTSWRKEEDEKEG